MGKGEGSFYKNRKKELWFFGGKCHNSVHLWVELKYCFRSNQENKFQNFSLRSLSFMCCRWIVCQSVLIPRNSHALRKFWGLIVILEQFIGGETCNGAQLVAVGERGLPFFAKLKKSPLILEKIPGLIDWRCCITRKNLQNCSLFVGSLSLMCCRWNVYRGALFLTNLLCYEKVLAASL